MKILVETTGEFQLLDPVSGVLVHAHRPTVAPPTTFLNSRAVAQQVKHLGDLVDEATDEEFAKYWSESEDKALAVASFLASFGVDAEPKASPAKKQSKK